MTEATKKPTLLLVDGHSLAFRSFYAFTKGGEGGLTTKEGVPTSVTFGFLKTLLENCKTLKPKGVTIAFDTPEPTFRHKADPNYKANRDIAPDIFFQDLEQLQKILQEELDLTLCMAPGFEADDVLGTLATQASINGWSVRILSGDRDLFQLVDDELDIAVLYMGGGPYTKNNGPRLINESGVKTKLGVSPKKVIDLKALTGDSSDNIPGVKGIGPKTAIKLLEENGDLDGVYASLKEVEAEGDKAIKGTIKGAVKSKLRQDKDNAYLSRELAEILVEVPLKEIPRFELGEVDNENLKKRLQTLELSSLVQQVPSFITTFSKRERRDNLDKLSTISTQERDEYSKHLQSSSDHLVQHPIPTLEPEIITSTAQLESLLIRLDHCLKSATPVALDTETTSLNPFKAELVGIGFCWGDSYNDLAYIPIGHIHDGKEGDAQNTNQLPLEEIISSLSTWIGSTKRHKVLQNSKFDRLIFLRHGLQLHGVVMDTLLADYICDSTSKHSLEVISKREFGFSPQSFTSLVSKGETFANVDITNASLYCGMDVYLTRKLFFRLKKHLKEMGPELTCLLEQIELPLEPVLAEMESTGIRIDIPYLQSLSKELKETLNQLEINAHQLAGIKFNLASPKQLGELLFGHLNLDRKKSRRTKTGWSTDANVLEKLEADHPVVGRVIEHRVLSKLLSTYVDALPQLVEEETGRVHTDFNQAVTATGRLSSSNPNLQNIPIRTEFSRRIRKAFLPQANWKLLSADYSQIELRILAHLSEEQVLQEAYRNQEDVHTLTAKLLFEKETINSDERRIGKTINFGVIYGMGSHRLARSTGLSQAEAKEFLRLYRERYPKVFSFLELQERLALSKGYVKTLLGRRRQFNFNPNGLGRLRGQDPYNINLELARRGGIEAQQLRAAANAPIQGSSADIIKIAMIKLQSNIKSASLPARLLLQVHDELVLEVQPAALEEVEKIVRKTMEEAVSLRVPLIVETGVGNNWMETK